MSKYENDNLIIKSHFDNLNTESIRNKAYERWFESDENSGGLDSRGNCSSMVLLLFRSHFFLFVLSDFKS